jgi:hypothetical protein
MRRLGVFNVCLAVGIAIVNAINPVLGADGACCSAHVQQHSGLTARASGNWSNPAVWGGTLPGSGARVCIPTGMTVTLDVDPPDLTGMVIDGTLRVSPRDTRITAGWIMVHGLFEIGTQATPFPNKATITLTGTNTNENLMCTGMDMGTKFLTAMNGGRIVMHAPVETTWTRLAANAGQGATTITVDNATGWRAGDVIVIANRTAVRGQTERRTLTAVRRNTLTLDRALSFPHSGTAPSIGGRRLEMRSEVGRLTRRIVIQGDTASTNLRFGGHVMIMKGGVAQLDGVEFVRMGQFNKLGRYPFHWHLLGDASGQYIRNCAVHTSFQRGIVVHGTRKTLVERNVVYDTPGHNFSIEDAAATDNSLSGNLAIENRVVNFTDPALAEQGDNQAANYWIRAAKNTFIGNVAAASMAHGFWYDNVVDGPTVFRQNIGHSSYSQSINTDFVRDSGLFVVNVGTVPLEFNDSLFYQNNVGVWPSEMGLMTFKNISFVDHWRGPAMVMDTGLATVTFENSLNVGRTRNPGPGEATDSGNSLPPAYLIQYSGQLALKNPTFANYGSTPLLSANDIFVEWQAEFFITGAVLINTAPEARLLHEQTISVLTDSSWGLPPGVYVNGLRPQIADTNATPLVLGEELSPFLRSPSLRGYGLLRTWIPDSQFFALPWHQPNSRMVRSDGLGYSDPDLDGFRVMCGGLFEYSAQQAPTTSQFYISLDNMGTPMPVGVTETAVISLPLTQAPRGITRIADLNEDSVTETGATQLRPVSSRSAFDAARDKSFFYDTVAKRLWLQADARWLVIRR